FLTRSRSRSDSVHLQTLRPSRDCGWWSLTLRTEQSVDGRADDVFGANAPEVEEADDVGSAWTRRRVLRSKLSGTWRRYAMTAYLIIRNKITEAGKFEEYRVKVRPMIGKHGGTILTKGGTQKRPEGGHWRPELGAIFEFPDMNSLNA